MSRLSNYIPPSSKEVKPQKNSSSHDRNTYPTWMTKEEFDICRSDAYRAYEICHTRIQERQQQLLMARKLNDALMQDPQYQYAHTVQSFEELKKEHVQLNEAFNDLETINETILEVIETLRNDKHQLLLELNSIKHEIAVQFIDSTQQELREKHLAGYVESLDIKLNSQETQLQHLEDETREYSKALLNLSNETSALEAASHTLSLQSSSLSELRQHLDGTRMSHERAIQTLEREVEEKAREITLHDQQLWEFKKDMSLRILALQEKAQEGDEELGRLRRLSEHEITTLTTQNKALNLECKNKADALYAIRKERSDFNSVARREINIKREEIHQCESIIDLVMKQNNGIAASIARTLKQNQDGDHQIREKDMMNNRSLVEQANFISMLHMELQVTREDLYLMRARLCHHCSNVMNSEEDAQDGTLKAIREDAAIQAKTLLDTQLRESGFDPGALVPSAQCKSDFPGSLASNANLMNSSYGTINLPSAMSQGAYSIREANTNTKSNTSQTLDTAALETNALNEELRRTKEALDALNRQLLEERLQREKERREEEAHRQQKEEELMLQKTIDEFNQKRKEEDSRKATAGETKQVYTVRLVDNTRKKIEAYPSDLVLDVVVRICEKLGIRSCELFHLAHCENENSVLGSIDRFLDKSKTLEEERVHPKCNLVFKSKHYKRMTSWNDSAAQEYIFRQVQQNIVGGYYPASEKLAVALASYDLQKEFGDYSLRKKLSYFDRLGLDAYLPVTVSLHDFDYWQDRFSYIHMARKGLSPHEARTQYLNHFSKMSPYWGMTFFDIRDKENRSFLAAVAEDGLHILSSNKEHILSSWRFDELAGWEKSSTGVFVKRRGFNKMTFFATSSKQAKELTDTLDEYYMLLDYKTRERLAINLEHKDDIRSRLPPPEIFHTPIVNRHRPVEFNSRLEVLKGLYMEHCSAPLQERDDAITRQPVSAFTQAIDRAIDSNGVLEILDLSTSNVGIDDRQMRVIHDVFVKVMEQYRPPDLAQWTEDIDVKTLNLGQRQTPLLSELSIDHICDWIRHLPNLSILDLSYIPLENYESDLVSALKRTSQLRELVLVGCKISTQGFSNLLEIFSIVSNLERLDVQENRITHASLVDLAGIMESERCKLKDLNVGFNKIELRGLESLIRVQIRRHLLRKLNISGNYFGLGAVGKLREMLSHMTGMENLNLSQWGITGDQVLQITSQLEYQSEIKCITLNDNDISHGIAPLELIAPESATTVPPDLAMSLFRFLQRGSFSNVSELYIDRCNITAAVGSAIASVLRDNTKLTVLSLAENSVATTKGDLPEMWYQMLTSNNFLERLNLTSNNIQFEGISRFFTALCTNRSIKELDLSGNFYDHYSTETKHDELTLFIETNTSVKVLKLNHMYLKDDALCVLGKALERNRSIQIVEAKNNEFTIRGINEFSKSLARNIALRKLHLQCRSLHINEELYLHAYKNMVESSNLDTLEM